MAEPERTCKCEAQMERMDLRVGPVPWVIDYCPDCDLVYTDEKGWEHVPEDSP